MPGVTVNRLCGSGLEAVNDAARRIRDGEADIVIAGGVESMTRAPHVTLKPSEAFPRGERVLHDTTLGWRLVNPRMADLGYHPISLAGAGDSDVEGLGDLLSRIGLADTGSRAGDVVGVAVLGGSGGIARHPFGEAHDHAVDGAETHVVYHRGVRLQADDDPSGHVADGDRVLAVIGRAHHLALDIQRLAVDVDGDGRNRAGSRGGRGSDVRQSRLRASN